MKTFLTSLVLAINIFAISLVPRVVYADAATEVCKGIGLVESKGDCTQDADKSVTSVVKNIVNLLSFITGIAAVIMIIISGFKYITSSGDSNGINSAKSTLVYAIIGLVIVAIAQIIVRFVLAKATSIK